MMSKIPVRALKGDSPAESLRSAVVLPDPNPESPLPNPGSRSAAQPRLVESYGKLPLGFEINKGQTDSRVKFLARGNGYALFLTGDEAVLALKKSEVRSQEGRRSGLHIRVAQTSASGLRLFRRGCDHVG